MKDFYESIHLVSIDPMGGGSIIAEHFIDVQKGEDWATKQNQQGMNVYFTVNDVRSGLNKKAKKEDVTFIRAFWIDLDPDKNKNRDEERIRLQQLIKGLRLKPSLIIDTGNGYGVYWYLEHCLEANAANIIMNEEYNHLIAQYLGGDACFNVDRIMRYPGTINYPTKTKLRAGYTQCNSKIVKTNQNRYSPETIKEWINTFIDGLVKSSDQKKKKNTSGKKPSKKLEMLLERDEKVMQLWNGHSTNGQNDESRSGFDMTLIALLKSRGLNEKETFSALEKFTYGKLGEMKDPERYFIKMWEGTKAEQPLIFRVGAESITGRYAYIKDQDKFYDGQAGIFLSKEALNCAHLKKFPGGKQGPKAAEAFFLDPEAIITDTVTWQPNTPKVVEEMGAIKLNIYIQPTMKVTEESIEIWLEHLKFLMPEKSQRKHLLDWMAFTMQHPEKKINHQILMAGNARVGKDMLFQPMIEYFGYHNVSHPQAEQMHDSFNEYLNGKKLIMVEEIMNFEKRSFENQLKPLCAAPPKYLHINSKGLKQYEIPNVVALVFFSNEVDSISIRTKGDTRYYCLWIDAIKKEPEYYCKIFDWYENGGYEAVAGYLMRRNVKNFNNGTGAPETEYRREIGAMSMSDHESMVHEAIAGYQEPFESDLVTSKQLVAAFKDNGLKSNKRAGTLLKQQRCEKFECVYKEDGKSKKVYIWAVRNIEKYKELGATELVKLFEDQF